MSPHGKKREVQKIIRLKILESAKIILLLKGYQLLHGTNKDVGDFQITGKIKRIEDKCFEGNITQQWNDIIDHNKKYWDDIILNAVMRFLFYLFPRDYVIKIQFNSDFKAEKRINGYLFTNFPGDTNEDK